MPYEVRTPVFEGSLETLCTLAGSGRVDVGAVKLTALVEGFLLELETQDPFDLEMATEFTLLAAALLRIKCRSLLPDAAPLDDDEPSYPERDAILARLLECTAFSLAGWQLAELAGSASLSLPHPGGLEESLVARLAENFEEPTPLELARAFATALIPAEPPPQVDSGHMHGILIPLSKTAARVVSRLADSNRARFAELSDEQTVPALVAVFLVILQLCKAGVVELEQASCFSELWVAWLGGDPGAVLAGLSWD